MQNPWRCRLLRAAPRGPEWSATWTQTYGRFVAYRCCADVINLHLRVMGRPLDTSRKKCRYDGGLAWLDKFEQSLGRGSFPTGNGPSERYRCVEHQRRHHRRPSSIMDLISPSSSRCPDPLDSAIALRRARSESTARRTSRRSRLSTGTTRATGLPYLVTTSSSPLATRWSSVPNRILASRAVTLALIVPSRTTNQSVTRIAHGGDGVHGRPSPCRCSGQDMVAWPATATL